MLPRPHDAQHLVLSTARRFNVVDCGRRWGKTMLGLNRCADPAVLMYPVGWFSPTYKMLAEVWREAVRMLEPITVRRSAQEHRLELATGGVLEFWSLENPDVARGRRYRRVIVDEAAMVRELMEAWQYTLRPTLTDFEGDAWFLSTPKGRNGFWQMFQWGQDAAGYPDWRSWQMPTHTSPKIPPNEIEAMRRTLPERVYQQEILAVFLEDAGGVFRRVAEAATAVEQREPVAGHQYVMGVDWGKSDDFTVLTVLDATAKAVARVDRFNQIDYAVQVGRLRALAEVFKPLQIVAERNSMGEPLLELLLREGLPVYGFTTTNSTKAAAIDALALAFERGELALLADPVVIGELQAYEMERLPSGMMRYAAPEGMHDDCVMSLALAWQGAGRPVELADVNPFYQ